MSSGDSHLAVNVCVTGTTAQCVCVCPVGDCDLAVNVCVTGTTAQCVCLVGDSDLAVNMCVTGTTAQCVCLVGDSAGGTLAVAATLMALSSAVRLPDAVLSVYGCLLVKYAPSPSRLLSLMDPLLPVGVLPKCLSGMLLLHSYTCQVRSLQERGVERLWKVVS